MPFKKGQSGNPGGRPPRTPDDRRLQLLARAHTERAVAKLAALIDDKDGRIACTAAAAILDRAWGKPKEHVELNQTVEHVVTYGDYLAGKARTSPAARDPEASVQ